MSDTSTIRDVLSAELEWAEKKLEAADEEHEALQEGFEDLKPDIRDVATHPVVDDEDSPMDVLTTQYIRYRQKVIAAEQLRHKVLRLRIRGRSSMRSLSGPGGALKLNLDRLVDFPDLLDRAESLLKRSTVKLRTGWKVFYDTLDQVSELVTDCRNEYIEKTQKLSSRINELNATS